MDFSFTIENREYNAVSNTTKSISLSDGTDKYFFTDFTRLKGKTIIGISIARQSDNAQEQIRDCDNNIIVGDKALLSSFLTLKNNSNTAIYENLPSRNLSFSTYNHQIGSFAQILMVNFNPEESFVKFANGGDIDDGTVYEITFWTAEADSCDVLVAGCN